MKATLIGMGCGPGTWTAEALSALRQADLVIGAPRRLASLPEDFAGSARQIAEYRPQRTADLLAESHAVNPCVLLGGDSGFYSAAAGLLPLLAARGIAARVLPGISSLQVLAARLGRPWQDWRLCSAHGVDCDPVHEVMGGRPVLFLTSGKEGLRSLCGELTAAGLGGLPVTVGEDLGQESERITALTAAKCLEMEFSALNVLLAEAAPLSVPRVPGIPDRDFIRDKVPMTKQEIRAVAMAKMAVRPDDICWDIGAGTGSVSVELALAARGVWAVEKSAEALELAVKNREKFCAWNLRLVKGEAPEALSAFPKPDVVFVGGSGGRLPEILDAVCLAGPEARVAVTAISLETLHTASASMAQMGWETEVTQIAVSRAREAGSHHLLTAQNPVFLITGTPAAVGKSRE